MEQKKGFLPMSGNFPKMADLSLKISTMSGEVKLCMEKNHFFAV